MTAIDIPEHSKIYFYTVSSRERGCQCMFRVNTGSILKLLDLDMVLFRFIPRLILCAHVRLFWLRTSPGDGLSTNRIHEEG